MNSNVPLFPGNFYHVYNRGLFRQSIFHEDDNCLYFLSLFVRYICPIANIYAYVLMKNHFHFALEIKLDSYAVHSVRHLSKHYSQCFSNCFNAYSKAFNKRYHREGPLFERPFKRKLVSDKEQLRLLINYIHVNPKWHNFMDNYQDYPFSSYRAVLSDKPTNISRYLIRELYGGIIQFKNEDETAKDWYIIKELIDDDFD